MRSNSILDKIKENELEILLDFDRACKSLNIRYSLAYGTLLGAVRHKGFIPWDDDIDVAMPREDYEIFLKKGQQLLNKQYFLQTYETDKNYMGNYAKIRDTTTKLVEYNTQNMDAVGGIYIDIFPIDKVSSNKIIRRIDTLIYALIYAVKHSSTLERVKSSTNPLYKIVHFVLWPLAKLIGTHTLNRFETSLRIKNNKNANNLIYALDYIQPLSMKDKYLIPYEVYNNYENLVFEGKELSAIKQYDLYLTKVYGDYMTPPSKDKQISHHKFIEIDF